MLKQKGALSNLSKVQTFFKMLAESKIQASKSLQQIGVPSKSFLSSYTHSMLFDSEKTVFTGELS